jgi:hypothetical protein
MLQRQSPGVTGRSAQAVGAGVGSAGAGRGAGV